ncbi:hypothetical protein SNEBB_009792 [Seison nebaliae]|nr:hypothetical protein SNEBB_009792 [Seison nebaliae]
MMAKLEKSRVVQQLIHPQHFVSDDWKSYQYFHEYSILSPRGRRVPFIIFASTEFAKSDFIIKGLISKKSNNIYSATEAIFIANQMEFNLNFPYSENEELTSNYFHIEFVGNTTENPLDHIYIGFNHNLPRSMIMWKETSIRFKNMHSPYWDILPTHEAANFTSLKGTGVVARVDNVQRLNGWCVSIARFKEEIFVLDTKQQTDSTSTILDHLSISIERQEIRFYALLFVQVQVVDAIQLGEFRRYNSDDGNVIINCSPFLNLDWKIRGQVDNVFPTPIIVDIASPQNPLVLNKEKPKETEAAAKQDKGVTTGTTWYMGQYAAGEDFDNEIIFVMIMKKGQWFAIGRDSFHEIHDDKIRIKMGEPYQKIILVRVKKEVDEKKMKKIIMDFEHFCAHKLSTFMISSQADTEKSTLKQRLIICPSREASKNEAKLAMTNYDDHLKCNCELPLRDGQVIYVTTNGNVKINKELRRPKVVPSDDGKKKLSAKPKFSKLSFVTQESLPKPPLNVEEDEPSHDPQTYEGYEYEETTNEYGTEPATDAYDEYSEYQSTSNSDADSTMSKDKKSKRRSRTNVRGSKQGSEYVVPPQQLETPQQEVTDSSQNYTSAAENDYSGVETSEYKNESSAAQDESSPAQNDSSPVEQESSPMEQESSQIEKGGSPVAESPEPPPQDDGSYHSYHEDYQEPEPSNANTSEDEGNEETNMENVNENANTRARTRREAKKVTVEEPQPQMEQFSFIYNSVMSRTILYTLNIVDKYLQRAREKYSGFLIFQEQQEEGSVGIDGLPKKKLLCKCSIEIEKPKEGLKKCTINETIAENSVIPIPPNGVDKITYEFLNLVAEHLVELDINILGKVLGLSPARIAHINYLATEKSEYVNNRRNEGAESKESKEEITASGIYKGQKPMKMSGNLTHDVRAEMLYSWIQRQPRFTNRRKELKSLLDGIGYGEVITELTAYPKGDVEDLKGVLTFREALISFLNQMDEKINTVSNSMVSRERRIPYRFGKRNLEDISWKRSMPWRFG